MSIAQSGKYPERRAAYAPSVSTTLLHQRCRRIYDGGELIVEDTYGTHNVKLPAGDMILYPATSLHRVAPVTRGARIASFFWIQSMVKDDGERTLLFNLDRTIVQLGQSASPISPRWCSSRRSITTSCANGARHERAAACTGLARRSADDDAAGRTAEFASKQRSSGVGWKPPPRAACRRRNCCSGGCCSKARAWRKTNAPRSRVSCARRRTATSQEGRAGMVGRCYEKRLGCGAGFHARSGELRDRRRGRSHLGAIRPSGHLVARWISA